MLPELRCCRQTYDGVSNMMGKHTGVSTKISAEQPKAAATHCQGDSWSLIVKSLTKDCEILRDTMVTVGEICVLVKYSPKGEKMIDKITDNIEGKSDKETANQRASKLDKLLRNEMDSPCWVLKKNKGKLSSIIATYER